MMRARSPKWTNWAGTASCTPEAILRPRNEYELQGMVTQARDKGQTIRVVGSGHSFGAIACTDEVMISLDRLDAAIRMNRSDQTITVSGGMSLRKLNEVLARFGFAMTNLGDIAYQSVAGAVSTGTHGTGLAFGGLATQLRGMRLVTATGQAINCTADAHPEIFDVARIGLGALGIISEATIAVEPAFRLHAIEEPQPLDEILDAWSERVR